MFCLIRVLRHGCLFVKQCVTRATYQLAHQYIISFYNIVLDPTRKDVRNDHSISTVPRPVYDFSHFIMPRCFHSGPTQNIYSRESFGEMTNFVPIDLLLR